MTIDYKELIRGIKEKYTEDMELQCTLNILENACSMMERALKNHELVYKLQDYTDEELRKLDSDIICDICEDEIDKLIGIYDKNTIRTDTDFRGRCGFMRNGDFSIGYISDSDSYSSCKGWFSVTLDELRNPELYKARRKKELEDLDTAKKEAEIKELERRLRILRNS